MVDAFKVPFPREILRAKIASDKSGRAFLIEPSDWGARNVFSYDIEKSRGHLRIHGPGQHPVIGEIQVDKEILDALLASLERPPVTEVGNNDEEKLDPYHDQPITKDHTGDNFGLNLEARTKGGKQPEFDQALQTAINRIRDDLILNKQKVRPAAVIESIRKNSSRDVHYCFEPPIPGCDDLWVDGHKLVWKDRDGRERDISLRSLNRYVARSLAHSTLTGD